jgi:ATP-binding cassette subfamily C (CFTR/MRP) protein 1
LWKNWKVTYSCNQFFFISPKFCSGKSTFVSSLLRLIDPSDGQIVIDGIDIARMKRNGVRNRIICLPQDPLIFPGTFRFNIDPANMMPDDTVIIEILKTVNLWTLIEKRGGLEAELKVDGLSHGEQQLLALVRALLRKRVANGRCILVLDEATSNLDQATEDIIQKIIDQEFKDNTVITVAHRLETVAKVDEILVLEKGVVIKQGPPSEVLDLGNTAYTNET